MLRVFTHVDLNERKKKYIVGFCRVRSVRSAKPFYLSSLNDQSTIMPNQDTENVF